MVRWHSSYNGYLNPEVVFFVTVLFLGMDTVAFPCYGLKTARMRWRK